MPNIVLSRCPLVCFLIVIASGGTDRPIMAIEDRMLRDELAGYADYLIPGIW